MDVGEARQQFVGGLLGLVEIAGVDHVDDGVGCVGQFVVAVVAVPKVIGWDGRRVGSGEGCGVTGGGLVLAMQQLLVFLAAAAGQGSFRPILAISPTFIKDGPVYQAVLADARFHEQLLVFDRDLAADRPSGRCWPAAACCIRLV